jgi:hypothetical protein
VDAGNGIVETTAVEPGVEVATENAAREAARRPAADRVNGAPLAFSVIL